MLRSTCLLLIILAGSLGLLGCSTGPGAGDPALLQCLQQLEQLQEAVQRYGVQDAQYQPVAGFPTYRTTRFWSSFQGQDLDQQLDQQQAHWWRRQLHSLGMDSLALEWSNLPPSAQRALPDFRHFQQQCDGQLFQHSLQRPIPADAIDVADSYNDLQRFFGLYALIKYAAAASIAEYQEEMRERINAFNGLPPPTRVYGPRQKPVTTGQEISQWIRQSMENHPLALPELTADQLQALFIHHAPQLEIAYTSAADIPGTAQWRNRNGQLTRHINTQQTTLYTYPSYIRFQQNILLQLNYTLWFSERPKPTADDWYGGKLDGLVWRVTLQSDGSVLFYDSIHPCGCYHSVHIPDHSQLAPLTDSRATSTALEPILFFRSTLPPAAAQPRLHVESATHYLAQVTPGRDTPGARQYQLQPYDSLRALAAGSGFKNWFDADGLIASSARRERFFLWPLGVENTGAMRQQGNHAIAFAGKRHFDEASVETLLDLDPPGLGH